jgi:hypothetical protein
VTGDGVYVIDGQPYRMARDTTIEQDFYVMRQLRKAGLADIAPGAGEVAQDYALRVVHSVIEGGAPFELLGGLLMPDDRGLRWSPERAETTARVLASATAPEDKAKIQGLLVSVLSGFFAAGLGCSIPFPTASGRAAGQPGHGSTAGAATSGTSATGDSSSGSSPDGITAATPR